MDVYAVNDLCVSLAAMSVRAGARTVEATTALSKTREIGCRLQDSCSYATGSLRRGLPEEDSHHVHMIVSKSQSRVDHAPRTKSRRQFFPYLLSQASRFGFSVHNCSQRYIMIQIFH